MVKATKRLAAVEEQQLNYLEERVRSLEETKNPDRTMVDKAKKDLLPFSFHICNLVCFASLRRCAVRRYHDEMKPSHDLFVVIVFAC